MINKETKIYEIKQKYLKINKQFKRNYTINDYNNFEENLSAYIDNELLPKEAIKIKNFIIINPYAKTKYMDNVRLINLLKSDVSIYLKTLKKIKYNIL